MSNKWRTGKPPKDGMPFIAMCGYPWRPTLGMWNEHDADYVCVSIGAQEMQNGTVDTWFENEHYMGSDIVAWQHMPEVGI